MASIAFIGTGANARFLVQAADWVTTSEDLLPLNANLPAYQPLALTSGRLRAARVRYGGVLPAMFLLAGVGVWTDRAITGAA